MEQDVKKPENVDINLQGLSRDWIMLYDSGETDIKLNPLWDMLERASGGKEAVIGGEIVKVFRGIDMNIIRKLKLRKKDKEELISLIYAHKIKKK